MSKDCATHIELAGVSAIFAKSVEKGVHYVENLGDRDRNVFRGVLASKPYGEEVEISKIECIR